MEFLNKVELKGIIGGVKLLQVGDNKVANISVLTNYMSQDKSGMPVVETQWHNVKVWDTASKTSLDEYGKGDKVHLTGRLRTIRYTAPEGDRTFTEIVASKINKLEEE